MPAPSPPPNRSNATGVATRSCRYGTLSFFRDDDPIGRSLLEYGEWAQLEIQFLMQFVGPGDTVLDLGANIGTHTVALAKQVGDTGRVIAFEPQGRVFDLLRENVAQNGLSAVEVRRQGLASACGEMWVPVLDHTAHVNAGSVALIKNGADGQSEPVTVTTVDALELSRCDLVKLDVEGMELEVLDGARATIAHCAPVIYNECNTVEGGWGVARFGLDLGHQVFLHRVPAFNPDNFLANPLNTFGLAHETSLLLVPPRRSSCLASLSAGWAITPIASKDDLERAMTATPRWCQPGTGSVGAEVSPGRTTELETTAGPAAERFGVLERSLVEVERPLAEVAGGREAESRVPSRDEMLVAASGLFDAAYYRAHNPDLSAHTDESLLRHYVNYGGREGRDPCASFQSAWYLQDNPDVRAAGLDPLVHYLTSGAAEGRRPNPVFDTTYYVRQGSATAFGLNPLAHYLRFGAAAGLDPSASFDTSRYVAEHPELKVSGKNPLVHYLEASAEVRTTPAGGSTPGYRKMPPPLAPKREEWEAMIASRATRSEKPPLVDVIVPVYRGYQETLRCLFSVLSASCATPLALVVVDDASPEAELRSELEYLSEAGLIELLRNERNGGFVASCNRGMSSHPDRDVVILNSDTEVYGDWLDRLRASALTGPKVGTVTPLSNNATICSYPYFLRDNDMALEADYAEIDRLAARVNAGRSVPVPTAVGFCMYIRRECLNEVGLFDLEGFGRGYGEENDLSLRASAKGWTHLMSCDVFVRHVGGVSFGPEKQARMEHAAEELHKRFPDYFPNLERFVQADPARNARGRLDYARLARRASSKAILFVTHNWGGGIERHVQDLRQGLESEGVAVFVLRPHPSEKMFAVLSHPDVLTPNLVPFDIRSGAEPLASVLRALRIARIHVHSLVGFDQTVAAAWIQAVSRTLEAPYEFTVHDYICICPRINLIDGSGVHCREPGIDGCQQCVEANGSPFGQVSVRSWVEAYGRLLRGAHGVLAPGKDVADRVARHLPGVTPRVLPHPEGPFTRPAAPLVRRGERDPLRVAVIGAIAQHKGFEVLRACARDAAERSLPLRFYLFGYSCNDAALTVNPNVSVLGRYEERDLPALLAKHPCHCAFLPSVGPETYSYTLSAAIAASLHPIAFDLGVISERIRELGWGTLIPLTVDPVVVNHALLSADLSAQPDWHKVSSRPKPIVSIVHEYYGIEPG